MSVKGMKICHVNTRSLYSKLNQLSVLFDDVDILCCTETWLDNRFGNDMVSLQGKVIFRCDRRCNVNSYNDRITAGGVCIYIDNKFANFKSCIPEFTKVTQDYEILTVYTARPDHRYMLTICVYKPPKGDIFKCIEFLKRIVSDIRYKNREIWILGDFNTDLLKRGEPRTTAMFNFAKNAGLTHLINQVTRPNLRGGSCIDHIMTNCVFVQDHGILTDMISDHFTVFAVRKKKREDKRVVSEYVRDYSKFNSVVFGQLLDQTNWHVFDFEINPEIQWKIIYDRVIEILTVMCPIKKVHTRLVKKKWLTKEIYALIREKRCLIKRFLNTRNPAVLEEIRKARNVLKSTIDKAKSNYIRNLLGATKKDPKKFWRNIKTLINNNGDNPERVVFRDPNTGDNISEDAVPNFLNQFFANISERVCDPAISKAYVPEDIPPSQFFFTPPEQYEIMLFAEEIDINSASGINGINTAICKCLLIHIPDKFRLLFSNSMFTSYFPFTWTLSRVKLIPKAGDLSNSGNWRPISMTNIFAKLLEKLVHSQLLKYLLDNQIISKNQFGFLPGKSTHEAIFKVVQNVHSALNNKKLTGMLLLDIAKAFNCISHDILLAKMASAGFDRTVIQWFRSYLHRTQQVSIYNKLSDAIAVPNGIAQGTVLGPILFIFYINDIFNCVNFVKMSLFADDCVMYLSGNNWDIIQRRMQLDFDSIIDWNLRNNLRLNHDKTHAVIFGARMKLANIVDPLPFRILDKRVKYVKEHAYLGIILDSTMSLVPLMKSVKKRVSNKVFMLRKIRKYLNFQSSVVVYKQTILPIIDYAGFLLLACNNGAIEELQIIQNDVLRICNMSKLSDKVSIVELHKKCKILGLKKRMQKQLLWLMYILSQDDCYIRIPPRETRAALKVVFKVPARKLPIYEHSPYYQGTILWNELDKDTQKRNNIIVFKKDIEKLYTGYKAI